MVPGRVMQEVRLSHPCVSYAWEKSGDQGNPKVTFMLKYIHLSGSKDVHECLISVSSCEDEEIQRCCSKYGGATVRTLNTSAPHPFKNGGVGHMRVIFGYVRVGGV